MIFFGWGTKSNQKDLSPTQAMVVSASYVHLFWLLTVTFKEKYRFAQFVPDTGWAVRDVSVEEAVELSDGEPPQIHWWWRFSGLVILGLIALVVVFALFMNSVMG